MDSKPRPLAQEPACLHHSVVPHPCPPGPGPSAGGHMATRKQSLLIGFAVRAVGRPVLLCLPRSGAAIVHSDTLRSRAGVGRGKHVSPHMRAYTGRPATGHHPAPGTVGVRDVNFLQCSQRRVPVPTDCFLPTLGSSGSGALRGEEGSSSSWPPRGSVTATPVSSEQTVGEPTPDKHKAASDQPSDRNKIHSASTLLSG